MPEAPLLNKWERMGLKRECLLYICDDEPKFLCDISENAGRWLPEAAIRTFTEGSELMKALKEEVCDILLLDIDMPGISGLAIAESLAALDRKPLLIFVTSHDELVYDSLQFHPFGFVRKHLLQAELGQVLRDCRQELREREGNASRIFRFRIPNADVKLYQSEILYFEADGNYLKVFTADREYRFRNTLSAVENALSADGFIRIHKGFLVNQSAIRMLTMEEAQLTNGSRIPIGRSYADMARKSFMRYMM